jgi:HAE1 family hydrophobic/amphiphilic exporter-1
VNQALGRMPADVRTNGITVTKNTAGFSGAYGFSRDNRYDSLFISNYADRYIRDALKRVPGVGNVIIFGERKFAMRLWLDPNALAGRRLTAGDVLARCVNRTCRWRPARRRRRRVGRSAVPDERARQGRLIEAIGVRKRRVRAGEGGALVRVRDVGRVELGAESYARSCGSWPRSVGYRHPAAALGQRASRRSRACRPTMDALEKNFPPGLEARAGLRQRRCRARVDHRGAQDPGEAIVLVVLVMFLFLQNWRSTLIPALTIPVSLIGTFAFVKLFGFSINTLTLFGIVLATGIVVDDAIVVIENIERHMREYGKSAYRAAVRCHARSVLAVIVIGVVLVAVFVPVAFFPGTTGRIYQQFSLTIAFAVVLSVFNAVTFTPALSALLLDKETHTHGRFFTWSTASLRPAPISTCGPCA